jgi:hypothetical protein
MITGCVHHVEPLEPSNTNLSRSKEYQKEITALISIDAENKKWERIYLKEIAAAQDNDDTIAYKFFIVEYINLPRLRLPKWMEKEPGYVQRVSDVDILRGEFMKRAGIKIIFKKK